MASKSLSRAEIVTVVLTILIVGSLVFGQVSDARELANRSTCAANIRGIMQCLVIYSNDNSDYYPTLPLPSSATAYDVTFNGVTFPGNNPEKAFLAMGKEDALRSNPTAALWMLVMQGSVASKQFICKSDLDAAQTGAPLSNAQGQLYLNFSSANSFSYSTAYPWTEKAGKVVVADYWKNTMDSSVPLVSDMAPYFGRVDPKNTDTEVPATPEAQAQTARMIRDLTSPDFGTREAASQELSSKGPDAFPGLRQAAAASNNPELIARVMNGATTVTEKWVVTKANSANHLYEGQNIAFGDAHAEFLRVPAAGENNDSIWGIIKDASGDNRQEVPIAAGSLPHPITGTMGNFDTVMVPTRDARGNLK